ncbi:MAG: hypothetical protein M1832_003463 [Thelocarpon impressellum]|nr:MAG: hypothetical protein M1832_003463 [Thelocarpon impressellum]
MALGNPTFLLGIAVLLYLSSFVLFALLRIATGISIQRLGFNSLRRIAYTPKDGIKLEIRGLGLILHRPTFAQPTWVSLVVEELRVTVDLAVLLGEHDGSAGPKENGSAVDADGPNCALEPDPTVATEGRVHVNSGPRRSRTWERMTTAKEKIKQLHRKIDWLRLVDVVATNTAFTIVDVGCVQVGSFTLAVDTRRKTVDRLRLFRHHVAPPSAHRPAEWMVTVRSILFTAENRESLEVLDHLTLNVHGILYNDLHGLRDAAISLKLGRVHVPYDDFVTCSTRIRHCHSVYGKKQSSSADGEWQYSLTDVMEELDMPGSREEKIMQTVSDSKEFVGSILRGVKEVQFAVASFGLTKKVRATVPSRTPFYVNVAMKEVGLDLHRLDQRTPAHRMYFSRDDVAHQALAAAIGLSMDLDDGQGAPERLIYVPMLTTTIKTTLPAKTVQATRDKDAAERNANILFANVVVTSPSVDLDPRHLPLVLDIVRYHRRHATPRGPGRSHHLISRLLPKASIKLSVHEPVLRVALPTMEPSRKGTDDYDLLISSISSISIEVESSHSSVGELHYSLASNFRVMLHQLYYQTSTGARHNLLMTDLLELKVHVSATPEVYVVASGNLQTFSVHMVRPEISEGVRQIVEQLRSDPTADAKESLKRSTPPNFLRKLPPWLLSFNLQGSDFGIEVGGVDPQISETTRGIALQLGSWTAEYKAQRNDALQTRGSRRRGTSRSSNSDNTFLDMPSPPSPQLKQRGSTDGRRLAVHVRGLEGYVVQCANSWESHPFLSLPRLEVAFSSSSDTQGAIFHINAFCRTLLVHYSLYRHYATGVAVMVLKKAFVRSKQSADERHEGALGGHPGSTLFTDAEMVQSPMAVPELVTVDVKAAFVQIKATMPADPPLMLHIFSLDTGRHRWAPPFVKSRLIRLYAEAPRMKGIWARVVSIKGARVDLRESRRKVKNNFYEEKSIDISAEATRVGVPYQLVPHKVSDNIVNVAKATEQLHHRFRTRTNEYILDKQPQGPKHVPRITFRSKQFLMELEDSPFEWKLSIIYRMGLVEQKHRLAREEAFRVKVKRMEEMRRRQGSSHLRNHSAYSRGRSQQEAGAEPSAHAGKDSESVHVRRRSSSRSGRDRGRRMRYNPKGESELSGGARVSVGEARLRLHEHNAQSWKKRVDWGIKRQKRAMKEIRGMVWGTDDRTEGVEITETILDMPQRPGLMTTLISDLNIIIDKPSFPRHDYAKFLHRVGKGIPHDTKYSLLVPVSVQLDMGEARVTLRDYPLPLLHVPALRSNQSSRTPSWSMKTDFVIAEEYRDHESSRHVKVNIVPPENRESTTTRKGAFDIDVRRTVAPVKTYSDVEIDINTGHATRITWGTSYQPAIQDMMMIIETFTKPQVDPSDRTGFWDKIRLTLHSRVNVNWKGDGDVHYVLKGSRDPYVVTGHGAGFVMCWRNNVRWRICRNEDPRKFMTVDSAEFILAIPDLSHHARQSMESISQDSDSVVSTSSYKDGAFFKKVVMKLSGNVQWLAGLVFERNLANGRRSFEFKPHYDITMKNPKFAKAPEGEVYDAYRGFRSHHIHLSIAVMAPVERDWSVTNLKPSDSYNTVHLSPRFHTHFFAWWSLFSGVMALPIRQGRLWPGLEKSSKKFGRHLATIKYNLLLSPLFISHIYKHKDVEDYSEERVAATGLKVRLDSFMLDVHQRREEIASVVKGRKNQVSTSGMRINRAQLDFISADIRAISASIAGTTAEELKRANEDTLASYQQPAASIDLSRFTIPDKDFSWIDMDDFVELDWILPTEANPETSILPLAFAPRFTYFRQTDHHDSETSKESCSSSFGNEDTHYCVMSHDNDPHRVQRDLVLARLRSLKTQMENHERSLGEAELKVVRDDYKDQGLKEQLHMLKQHGEILQRKKNFLHSMLRRASHRVKDPDQGAETNSSSEVGSEPEIEGMDATPVGDFSSDFNNRFIVHNVQLKWNNSLRNIILRYIHQVSQRRGFIYYMSRRAVKFILDIVEEQNRSKHPSQEPPSREHDKMKPADASSNADNGTEGNVQDRIEQLLGDAKKFVHADDPLSEEKGAGESGKDRAATDDPGEHIALEFTPQNSYHVRLIAPQIQLQSEKNPTAAVLVTAKGMQLKVIQIMDKDRVTDDVSGLVQRRFSMDMDSVQFFVSTRKSFAKQFLPMYSGTRYGTPVGSSWPPWVPMEVMFDFKSNPFGFSRVVQKTSASLRYDKYNTLRLKYNDELSSDEPGKNRDATDAETRIDQLWVEFPQVRAICDSAQYYAMYIIVLDLLLYSEPLEKVRSERLEKIMLASDFSDLRGAPEMVICLQDRIRQLKEIKMHFQVNARYLDRQGWEDRLLIERDLTSCEDELFFMMKAITTSQRKYDDRSDNNGLLKWSLSATEVVWHLIRERAEPLVEFQLQNASYERTDNSDGSNENAMQIGRIYGLNLLPDALYPAMIAPFFDNSNTFADGRDTKMLRVKWYMLEAIAGIPVMDHFEVNLFPLKVQLEREIGKKLFEYIFPGAGASGFEETTLSPGLPPGSSKRLTPAPSIVENGGAEDEPESPGAESNGTSAAYEDPETFIGTESLQARLKPTMTLPHSRSGAVPGKPKHGHSKSSDGHHFKFFQSKPKSESRAATIRAPTPKRSAESLKMPGRRSIERSYTNLSSLTMTPASSDRSVDKPKRFGIQRAASKDPGAEDNKYKDSRRSDDLTQMINRASNYMTLAYVKIPSVVLCLSYKGRGERNIEDVHDFVFRMPILEYRNKTWSNLDLALHLKRDVIKALISHTGAIIGNKFAHHRPTRQQQSRLREVANNSALLAGGDTLEVGSDASSQRGSSPGTGRSVSPSRRSFQLSQQEQGLARSGSFASLASTRPASVFASEAASTTSTAVASEEGHGFMHNTLSRHLTSLGQKARHKDGIADESEESHRRKSKMLLGKKILGSLN